MECLHVTNKLNAKKKTVQKNCTSLTFKKEEGKKGFMNIALIVHFHTQVPQNPGDRLM